MIILEFSTFLGRFHPVFVHLPIGFLILAILLEWYQRLKKQKVSSGLISTAWLIGLLSAIAAAATGWWLGETGLYEEELLFSHRWLGIAIVGITLMGWWLKKVPNKYPLWVQNSFNCLVLILLAVEGHKGGNLTHGETFLTEYAPSSIKSLLHPEKERNSIIAYSNPDSVKVYAHLLEPVFKEKCFACHNDEIKRGGLNMSHPDSLSQARSEDAILVPGRPSESELFKRITLDPSSVKFMPPTNKILTYDEIKIVEWWIKEGASFDAMVSSLGIPEEIGAVLLRKFNLNTAPRPWYEKVSIAPADSTLISELGQKGFMIKSLGTKNPLLDVKYVGNDLTPELIESLLAIKKHVTWLSLANTNVEDHWLKPVSSFENLTRLQLEKTNLTDAALQHINNLKHLEALNLYGTKITNASIDELKNMPHLKRVYLWGTEVDKENATSLGEANAGLEVIIGEN